MKSKVLILYRNTNYPLRTTIKDHLYSFKKYAPTKCYYLNTSLGKFPKYLSKINFDFIIFHTTFLSSRWSGDEKFRNHLEKISLVKNFQAIKIALPQDDFIYTDSLCDFINEFKIKYVFSAAPRSELPKIYHNVDFSKVSFFEVLTGYLDDKTIKKINAMAKKIKRRKIDIGYRAYKAPQSLGKFGFLKTQISDIFCQEAPKYGLKIDISTDGKDTLLGDAWYKFLLTCKYCIGVEGGSSILDRNGTIRAKTIDYLKLNPNATFEKIEQTCFPELDGLLKLQVLTPRHLEACATNTCQILLTGQYNGILKPRVHFIELARDFSNIEEVLRMVKNDQTREKLVTQAYKDIVESKKYTYKNFVEFVLQKATINQRPLKKYTLYEQFFYHWLNLKDKLNWLFIIFVRLAIYRLLRTFYLWINSLKFVPTSFLNNMPLYKRIIHLSKQ
ncbi:MAG TPA: hypothetical protein DDX47_00585 [Candidatus Jacksonbacteria bacterium]|nr:MAG: hypothetical protein UW45_C0019G0006 [Parcubacteria group bacterium GW2011_GWC2_44_22]OGY74644.1 MAG: hypothetical protein A2240_06005 [Candidatus Jacksonbacteria bacterium RIFOXYA2_FULL_43_12]OGY75347.1 MAG: hypothetical protein A2295_04170 [Candidatus Jacksonbacteria bacterium RIFOXYB2_FULL_44_15]OGY82043.1 MAG: hypothetical protein A2550_00535 [Candidatus Jacksonbacteria bacterium RIFOXYD2_FULL_43_21]HBH45852.1 hypothetical protein [Candidatus Jacksonbacteria bacterium]